MFNTHVFLIVGHSVANIDHFLECVSKDLFFQSNFQNDHTVANAIDLANSNWFWRLWTVGAGMATVWPPQSILKNQILTKELSHGS